MPYHLVSGTTKSPAKILLATLDSSQHFGTGYPFNHDLVGSLPQGNFLSGRSIHHIAIGLPKVTIQFRIDLLFIPIDLLQILRPFEKTHNDTTSIDQMSGNTVIPRLRKISSASGVVGRFAASAITFAFTLAAIS